MSKRRPESPRHPKIDPETREFILRSLGRRLPADIETGVDSDSQPPLTDIPSPPALAEVDTSSAEPET